MTTKQSYAEKTNGQNIDEKAKYPTLMQRQFNFLKYFHVLSCYN